MNIIHVIVTLDPAKGGPPAVVTRLAAAQAQQGHSVSIVSYSVSERRAQVDAMLQGVPGMAAVNIVEVDGRGRTERLFGRGVSQAIRHLMRPQSILHLHGVWEPMLLAAARTARRAGVPYAITPHGMLDPWSLSQGRLKKRLALLLAYRHMINHAAFLHALNADEETLLKPLGFRSPVHVIPNGVFIEEVEPLPKAGVFRDMHPELSHAPFILFLSRLHYKKGLDYLAHAFERVAAKNGSIRLVVAGPDGGAQDDFVQQIAQAKLTDRVHVIGPIYGPSKLGALVDASCFCLPSRQEGFSIAITEALACGVPVVISDACHFPEVAEAGAGEVVPLDADAVAQALLTIIGDEALRRRMSQAGRELVRSRFTWPKIAVRMVQCYEQSVH
ncbi:MAG TPA: glycosyltransferase [Phycisphaerales bacterium]|nr:glycosyltransferase [Phycisphaerales bacterium]HRQ75540.1 glycosyltransferase [Phycisphaerales bacterium]